MVAIVLAMMLIGSWAGMEFWKHVATIVAEAPPLRVIGVFAVVAFGVAADSRMRRELIKFIREWRLQEGGR